MPFVSVSEVTRRNRTHETKSAKFQLPKAARTSLQHCGAMYAESTVARKLKTQRASSPLPKRATGVSPRTWSPTVRRRHVSAVVSPPRRLSFAIERPRSPAEHYYVASPSSDRLPPEVGFLDYHDVAIALRHYGIEASFADAKHLLRQYGHPEGKLIDVVAFEELLHDLGVGSEYPAVDVEDPERAALAIALREASEKRIAMAAEKRMARATAQLQAAAWAAQAAEEEASEAARELARLHNLSEHQRRRRWHFFLGPKEPVRFDAWSTVTLPPYTGAVPSVRVVPAYAQPSRPALLYNHAQPYMYAYVRNSPRPTMAASPHWRV